MEFKRLEFTKLWTRAEDFPAVESDEVRVRADMQLLHDQTKEGLNGLMGELESETAADALGAKDRNGEKSTIQKLFDRLHELFAGIAAVTGVLGADDTTIPTSKAVSDAIKFSGALPAGGTAGQTLTKVSGDNYDMQWQNTPGDQVGDVLTTVRTDLGPEWIACDGSLMDADKAPELWPLLEKTAQRRKLTDLPVSGYGTKRIFGRNAVELSSVCEQFYIAGNLGGIGYCDLDTGQVVSVSAGECSCVNAAGINGRLFGLDWNGQEWVMCLGEYGGLKFYTSADLKQWTHKKTLSDLEIEANSSYGAVCRFLFDGTVYRVTGKYSGYQDGRMVTISADFERADGLSGIEGIMQMVDGVTFVIGDNGYLRVFAQGEAKTAISGGVVGAAGIVTRCDEDRFVIWPARCWEDTRYICVYDRSTGTLTSVVPDERASCFYAPYVDEEKGGMVFVGKSSSELAYADRRVFLALGADPGRKDSYTVEQIEQAQTDTVQDRLVKLEGQGFYTDDGQYYELSGSALYTCGPRWRPLPGIYPPNACCYIRVKSGE